MSNTRNEQIANDLLSLLRQFNRVVSVALVAGTFCIVVKTRKAAIGVLHDIGMSRAFDPKSIKASLIDGGMLAISATPRQVVA
jgi:hypothetical protein